MNLDQLASAYRRGATIDSLANVSGLSYGTVRRRLISAGVELRQRGPRPIELDAVATMPRPRQAGLRQALQDRRFTPAARRPNPQAGRSSRSARSASGAGDESVDVERLRTQMLDALERSDAAQRQAMIAAIDDDQLWLAAEALKAAMDDAYAPER